MTLDLTRPLESVARSCDFWLITAVEIPHNWFELRYSSIGTSKGKQAQALINEKYLWLCMSRSVILTPYDFMDITEIEMPSERFELGNGYRNPVMRPW